VIVEPERLVLPAIAAVSQIVITIVLITVSWRAANGRLRRNPWTGIRTPSTMRSDQAWVAGHRAALRLTLLYLVVLAAMLIAMVVAVRQASKPVANLVAIGGLFVFIPVALYSAFVASRAAKLADDHSDCHDPSLASPMPNPVSRKAIHVWAALNGLLLIVVCIALWYFAARSGSNGIPPNTSLGFRDQQTLASTQGWYAAQRAGFHIAAITETVVTAGVLAFAAVAYVRRFPPMWILVISTVGALSIVVCALIAGHYADEAAISANSSSRDHESSPPSPAAAVHRGIRCSAPGSLPSTVSRRPPSAALARRI
jgi:hypothetical protein